VRSSGLSVALGSRGSEFPSSGDALTVLLARGAVTVSGACWGMGGREGDGAFSTGTLTVSGAFGAGFSGVEAGSCGWSAGSGGGSGAWGPFPGRSGLQGRTGVNCGT
jgi:hypothetical protein